VLFVIVYFRVLLDHVVRPEIQVQTAREVNKVNLASLDNRVAMATVESLA